ncbi:MAG: hypothetical protein H7296_01325 [Bacteroidia bacterium]|nr:hypothetical protein [Bacteroidia bacterium]
MKVLDGQKTYRNMLSKGFTDAENKSNDHKRIEFWHQGKLSRARTKFSHNNQDLDTYLIGQISKQIGLTKPEFIEFAECTLSQGDYVTLLSNRSLL